jgi:hypothetical protein
MIAKNRTQMRRLRRCALIVLVTVVTLAPSTVEGQFGLGVFRGSKSDFKSFPDPGGRFQLEYPKDWQPLAGVGDVLVTFFQKNREATVIVERFHMNQPPGEIDDTFAQIQVEVLKERQAQVTDAVAKVVASNGSPVVMIDYSRPGLAGLERARQYSFPVGQELYRLNCSALATVFAKYDPMFVRIAASFMSGTAAAPGAPPAGTPPAASKK